MVLPPDVRGQQDVQRRDRRPPRNLAADFQPFGMLVEHRVDDVDKGLVAREQAVAPGQQIAFEPAFAQVLAQHFHHAAVGAEVGIVRHRLSHPDLARHGINRVKPVRRGLVGAEQAKVGAVQIKPHHFTQQAAKYARRLALHRTGRGHGNGMLVQARHHQGFEQLPAIGVRVKAHAPLACRRNRRELFAELACGVKQLFGLVALQPCFQLLQVFGLGELGNRHLVGAPGAFDRQAVHFLRPGPALGRFQDDHRPTRQRGGLRRTWRTRIALDLPDLRQHLVQRARQALVHQRRVIAFDDMRLIAVPAHQRDEVAAGYARQHCRVGDLVAVEVQDRQHSAVARRVQELVRVPARRQRPGLGLAVTDDARHDEARIVEGGTVGMGKRIAQLAALVDRAWGFRRQMAGNAARPRELAKQAAHAAAVTFNGGVTLGISAFEVGIGHNARPAVARANDEQHVQLMRFDQPVQVHVDHVQARRGAPVPEQAPLDVLQLKRRLKQRVVLQVNLPHRKVVGSAPPGVHLVQQIG